MQLHHCCDSEVTVEKIAQKNMTKSGQVRNLRSRYGSRHVSVLG
jgi:hypothetical protein